MPYREGNRLKAGLPHSAQKPPTLWVETRCSTERLERGGKRNVGL